MISFWIKESFKLIGRAKGSFLISLISMTISVFLIITSLLLIRISEVLQNDIKENININIFIKDSASGENIKVLEDQLKEKEFIN
ncbi:MAG: hypothetical protein ABI550_08025, partial [Ignavibacteriaceae bacterium]